MPQSHDLVVLFGNCKTIGFYGRAAKRFRARVLIAPPDLSYSQIRRSCSGESFIKPKESDDVGDLADLISLLHSFLDFSYYSSVAVESHQKVTFFRVILNTIT